uniref:Pyridine nucleotide-disulphide oxidoreductase dimerisation domain-containing protein n=1 Tax=Bionectria ochroleuca TaxID=29856 RepID=A0A8H7NHR0_BIOOC
MLKILKQDGISVLLKTSLKEVSATDSTDPAKAISATASGPEGTPQFTGSHILFAAGRVPNTKALNLDAAGIKTTSRGHIVVDETLQTSNPRVWALGDVKGPPAFTHVSYDDFRLLQGNLLEKDSHPTAMTTVDRILPYVVYTDPQLAHVGLHEKEAREKYPSAKIQVTRMPMAYVARALETDESRGMMKAIIDAESQKILGFTCLGLEGGEIMSVVQMAMIAGSKWTALRDAVWAHPSLAESLNNVWGMLE